MIVIDASAFLKLLLQGAPADPLWARVFAPGETLQAPFVLDLEIAQVLRRLSQRAEISVGRAKEALDDFASFAVYRHDPLSLLDRVWSLRENLTAYDAAYVALAEQLEAPLLTADGRLARAPGHRARIELV